MYSSRESPAKDFLAAAGLYVFTMGAIEGDVKGLLYAVEYRSSQEARSDSPLVASTRGISKLCQDLRSSLDNLGLSPRHKDGFEHSIAKVERALALRNEFVHGEWSTLGHRDPPKGTSPVFVTHYPLEHHRKQQRRATGRWWTLEDLQCLIAHGTQMRADLEELRKTLRTEYSINPVQWGSYASVEASPGTKAEKQG